MQQRSVQLADAIPLDFTSFLGDNLRRNGSVLVLRCDSGQTAECRRRDEWEEVTETVLRRMENLFKEFLLETRCKAKPDCSPPGYPLTAC